MSEEQGLSEVYGDVRELVKKSQLKWSALPEALLDGIAARLAYAIWSGEGDASDLCRTGVVGRVALDGGEVGVEELVSCRLQSYEFRGEPKLMTSCGVRYGERGVLRAPLCEHVVDVGTGEVLLVGDRPPTRLGSLQGGRVGSLEAVPAISTVTGRRGAAGDVLERVAGLRDWSVGVASSPEDGSEEWSACDLIVYSDRSPMELSLDRAHSELEELESTIEEAEEVVSLAEEAVEEVKELISEGDYPPERRYFHLYHLHHLHEGEGPEEAVSRLEEVASTARNRLNHGIEDLRRVRDELDGEVGLRVAELNVAYQHCDVLDSTLEQLADDEWLRQFGNFELDPKAIVAEVAVESGRVPEVPPGVLEALERGEEALAGLEGINPGEEVVDYSTAADMRRALEEVVRKVRYEYGL